jgi:cathepsin L
MRSHRSFFSCGPALLLGLLLALFAVTHAKTTWDKLEGYTFKHYMTEFGRTFPTEEEFIARKALFETRLAEMKRHNSDPTNTWKQGVNHLTDRTESEIRQLLGYNKAIASAFPPQGQAWKADRADLLDVAPQVDWRDKGVVSPVKDQGRCGSCWTFAAAETLESHWALATGQLPILSEQHILDCVPNPNQCGGKGGCAGGTVELAYQTLMEKEGGLASEWTYPYRSYFADAFECSFNASKTPVAAKLKDYVVLPSNQYLPVLQAIATVGPLTISVDASAWAAYESGVFDGCNQTNPDINHAVQLVGFGTDPKEGDYWLIRNSWSPAWGEAGYIRLRRSLKPSCGVDNNPQDGTGCNGGPPSVTVCGACGILYDVVYPLVAA